MKYLLLIAISCFFGQTIGQAQCTSGNCKNGYGTYRYPSGAVYRGDFKDGEIHGIGECRYTDGRRYIGEWVRRYPEGKGMMHFPNGKVLKGQWKRGRYVEEESTANKATPKKEEVVEIIEEKTTEIEIEVEHEIQVGCILGDCENGVGTLVYADGSKYEGHFKNKKINGEGTYLYADGTKYIGEWRDGYYHGEGSKYLSQTEVLTGLWQNGEYVGGKYGKGLRGCLAGNCENGEGTYVFKDGSKYIGEFKDGSLTGQGTCYYPSGNKYVGGWKYSNFHGMGTMYFATGTVVNGQWDNGAYLGEVTPSDDKLAKVKTTAPFDPTVTVWAVVVGVAKYNHMPTLNYTDDDAYRLYAFLMSPSGGALKDHQIQILVDEDAKKRNIVQAMQKTFSQADSNDVVLLYFSGHGFRGAFLPFDFDGYNNKLFHKEIKSLFNTCSAKFKLCIADACHSGSLNQFAARSISGSSTIASYYDAFTTIRGGTALFLSSKAEETSLESTGLRQGIFSHFLIRGLKGEADEDENKIVTIEELFDFVYKNVQAYTGNVQTPILEGDYDNRMPVAAVRE